jgi:tetratricopeptide (TPR) repeat protein
LVGLGLFVSVVAAFLPALRNGFVNLDDHLYVLENSHVIRGLTWGGFQWAFRNLEAGFWHPLTWLSILVDCQFYGLRAWGHHLTSVLLHATSTGVLFLALQRMTGATWRSAFVAALFGLHPLHVESVAWASERKDVLSGFFWMLSLWAYGHYVEETRLRSQRSVASRHRTIGHVSRFYLLSLAFFVCGLMSKPMTVTLPLMLLLLDWWPLGRMGYNTACARRTTIPALIWEKIPFLAVALIFGGITIYAEKRVGAIAAATAYPLGGRLQNALLAYASYLKQTLWPAGLAVFYPYPPGFPAGQVAGVGLLEVVISVLVLCRSRKRPYLAVGCIWYVVTLLPVIGLIQVGDFSRADRFTYLPLIGVFLVLSWGAYDLTRRWRPQAVALGAMGLVAIVLCCALTRQQLDHWKDTETLFRHALAVTKDNDFAHHSLGLALSKQGQMDEAIRQFQEALRPNPGYADAHDSLGTALAKQGQMDEAIHHIQEALRLDPNYAQAHNSLGWALAKRGQKDEAIRQFQEALRLKPDYVDAHDSLGTVLAEQGQMDEAIRQFQEALRLNPDYVEAHDSLGAVLAEHGQMDEAIRQFQEALRLNPYNAETHNNLAIALDGKGRLDEAIRHFQEALRLNPDYAQAHNNLGWALTKQGKLDEAIRHFQEALRCKPDYSQAKDNLARALKMKDSAAGR